MKINNTNSSRITRPVVIFISLVTLLFGYATTAMAQDGEKRGFQPGGSYVIGDLESVSTTNRNMTFHVPLASLPAGRGGLSAALSLTYNSKLWDVFTYTMTDPTAPPVGGGGGDCPEGQICHDQPPADGGGGGGGTVIPPYAQLTRDLMMQGMGGGWDYGYRYYLVLDTRDEHYDNEHEPQCPDHAVEYNYKLKVVFPDGGSHEFQPVGYLPTPPLFNDGYYKVSPDGWVNNCQSPTFGGYITSTMVYMSTDLTARLEIQHDSDSNWMNNPWALFLPDGTKVTGGNAPEKIYDRNDNYIEIQSVTSNGYPATKIVDQLGRAIIIQHGGGNANADHIFVNGVNGQQLETIIQWQYVWVNQWYHATPGNWNPGWPFDEQIISAFGVPASITLPNSLTYHFSYDGTVGTSAPTSASSGWGELTEVTLPTGLIATYQYDGFASSYAASDICGRGISVKDEEYQDQYDGSSVTRTQEWIYSTTQISTSARYTTITGPDNGVTKEYFDSTQQQVTKSERPDGSVVERIWAGSFGVKTEFTSITNASGTLVKTAIKDNTYDWNGNVTQVAEYDWVDYNTIHSGGLAIPSGATPSRLVVNTYANPASSSSSANYFAATTAPRVLRAVASSEIQNGSGTASSRSESFYDTSSLGTATAGNLTGQKTWDSTKGSISRPLTSSNSVSTSHTYDSFGNLTSSTDSKGIQSRVVYGVLLDVNQNPILDANGQQVQNLYPTETDAAYYDTVLQQTPSVQQRSSKTYDYSTGAVLTAIDLDNNVTTKTTYDIFGRPTLVQSAYNTSSERRTSTEYSDAYRRVITRSDRATLGDGQIVSIEHYDQLGRLRLSRSLENPTTESPYDETHGIKTQTRYVYSGSNSYSLTSTPYRASFSGGASGESTMGWKRSMSDNGGRLLEVQTFSGSTLPAPWGSNTASTGTVTTNYDANATRVTDQAGKVRRSVVDGLGRLIEVDEPNNNGNLDLNDSAVQPTNYSYNAAGSLIQIVQGSQTRSFTYSSLGRLLSGTNPEDGTIAYAYDNNGNLITKTDPRVLPNTSTHIATTITYDELNRAKVKTYNDGTPTVNYFYDNQSLPSGAPISPAYDRGVSYGKLVAVTYNGSEGNYYGYDLNGAVVKRVQRTNSVNYVVEATYNKAGAPTTVTYPTVPGATGRRTVNYTYSNDGQLGSLNSPATTYATGASVGSLAYTPHGALQSETYGNNLIHSIVYNSHLQPTAINLGTSSTPGSALALTYTYGTATTNNGNITGTTISAGSQTFAQTFTYDSLNRLTAAQENDNGSSTAAWQQNFGYDRFGNRTQYIGGGGGTQGAPATSGTGTVTIGGSEQSSYTCLDWEWDYEISDWYCASWGNVYDSGTVSAMVGSYTANVSFGSGSTSANIATALASNFNTNSSSPVTASVTGSTVTLTAKTTGSSTNYSLSTNVTFDSYDFGSGSFTATRSGPTLTGGSDGTAGSPGGSPDVTFNSNNQIVGFVYDPMGNVLADGHHTYTYNAENLINGVDLATNSYTYDGEAHRVKKASGNLLMVYDIGGKLIAEFDSGTGALKKEYIYGPGGLLATIEPTIGTRYTTEDHLGSPRIETDASGQVWSQHDYQPFGEEIANNVGARLQVLSYIGGVQNQPYANGNSDGLHRKFTGKERDTETGLDYSVARYYSSTQGRFTSADEFTGGPAELFDFAGSASTNPTMYADLAEPQSFNKYLYCYNNPLGDTDPDGHQTMVQKIKDAVIKGRQEHLEECPLDNYAEGLLKGAINTLLIDPGNAFADAFGHEKVTRFEPNDAVQDIGMYRGTQVALIGGLFLGKGIGADAEEPAAVAGRASIVNKGGSFGELDAMRKANGEEGVVAHHTPQNGAKITPRNDGPAVGMTEADHAQTRTFSGRGRGTLRTDSGLSPRQRLATDITDLRNLFGSKYNQGAIQAIKYAKTVEQFQRMMKQ